MSTFAEAYKCTECDFTQSRYFGLCPRCQEGTGIKYEVVGTTKTGRAAGPRLRPSKMKITKEKAIPSGIPELDVVLSEQQGFVSGQVISLGALPGTGKSTLTTQLARHLSILYVSAEETHNQVSKRGERLEVSEDNFNILSTDSWDDIKAAAVDWAYDLLIVDSIQAIEGSFLAYSKAIQYTSELTNIVKGREKNAILINQVTKGGEITGHNAIQHITDTVLSMETIGDHILISSIKNRFGTVGEILMLEHGPKGLIISKQNKLNEDMLPGALVIMELFGKNQRPVTIESLVVKTGSNNPMRKAVNINSNRIFTLAALLTKSGLNMGSSDIFINSSIPISNSQSTDMALTASIISSAREIPIKSVTGKLSLTGQVVGGTATVNKKQLKFETLSDLLKKI